MDVAQTGWTTYICASLVLCIFCVYIYAIFYVFHCSVIYIFLTKRALKKEKEQNLLDEELDIEDGIALETNENREYWLDKVNDHLEQLLEKSNMDNQPLRHITHHYQTKNMICNIKLKQLKNKLKETLKDKKDRNNLEMLVEESMRAWNNSFFTSWPILKVFWEFLFF